MSRCCRECDEWVKKLDLKEAEERRKWEREEALRIKSVADFFERNSRFKIGKTRSRIIQLLQWSFDKIEPFICYDNPYEIDIMIDNDRVLDLAKLKVDDKPNYCDMVFVFCEQTFLFRINGVSSECVEIKQDPIMSRFSSERVIESDSFLYTYLKSEYSRDVPDDIYGQIRLFLCAQEDDDSSELQETTRCGDTAEDWINENEVEWRWEDMYTSGDWLWECTARTLYIGFPINNDSGDYYISRNNFLPILAVRKQWEVTRDAYTNGFTCLNSIYDICGDNTSESDWEKNKEEYEEFIDTLFELTTKKMEKLYFQEDADYDSSVCSSDSEW